MKRKFKSLSIKNEPILLINNDNFQNNKLLSIDMVVIENILQCLNDDIESLLNLYICLFDLLLIDKSKISLLYNQIQNEYMKLMSNNIKNVFHINNHCDSYKFNLISDLTATGKYNNNKGKFETYTEKLDDIKLIINNEYYNLFLFIDSHICDKCRKNLYDYSYWELKDKMYLCSECADTLKKSADRNNLEYIYRSYDYKVDDIIKSTDVYRWITPKLLKLICNIQRKEKADTFAKLNNIRINSNTINSPKQLYFLKDAIEYIKYKKK